jgi:drug/metabolite transporter (DMT)-like permease
VGVVIAQVVNRIYGVGLASWTIYTIIAASLTYWGFSKSYSTAPSFFGAWFVGQAAMGILGLLASFLFFKDQISTAQWIGMVLTVTGGYLLIK